MDALKNGARNFYSMKFIAEISNVTPGGMGELRVTFNKVRHVRSPDWRGFCPDIKLDVPASQAHNFVVGRKATLQLELDRIA